METHFNMVSKQANILGLNTIYYQKNSCAWLITKDQAYTFGGRVDLVNKSVLQLKLLDEMVTCFNTVINIILNLNRDPLLSRI